MRKEKPQQHYNELSDPENGEECDSDEENPRSYSQIYAKKRYQTKVDNEATARKHSVKARGAETTGRHTEERVMELESIIREEEIFKDQLIAENIALRSLIDPKVASKAASQAYVRMEEEKGGKSEEREKGLVRDNEDMRGKIRGLQEQVRELRQINIEAQSNLQLAVVSVREAKEVDLLNKKLVLEINELKERLSSMDTFSRESDFFESKDVMDENERLRKELGDKKDGRDVMMYVIKSISKCIEKITNKPVITAPGLGATSSSSLLSLELSSILSTLQHESQLLSQRNVSLQSRNSSLLNDISYYEKQNKQLSEEITTMKDRCAFSDNRMDSSMISGDGIERTKFENGVNLGGNPNIDRSQSGKRTGEYREGENRIRGDKCGVSGDLEGFADTTSAEIEYLGRKIKKEIGSKMVYKSVLQTVMDCLADAKVTEITESLVSKKDEEVENQWIKEETEGLILFSRTGSPGIQERLEEIETREASIKENICRIGDELNVAFEKYRNTAYERSIIEKESAFRSHNEPRELKQNQRQQEKADSTYSDTSMGMQVISEPTRSVNKYEDSIVRTNPQSIAPLSPKPHSMSHSLHKVQDASNQQYISSLLLSLDRTIEEHTSNFAMLKQRLSDMKSKISN